MNKTKTILFFSLGIIAGGILVTFILNNYYSSEVPKENKKKAEVKTEEVISIEENENKVSDSIGNYLDKKIPIKIAGEEGVDKYENIDNNSSTYDSLMKIREVSSDKVNRDQLIATQKIGIKYLDIEDNKDSLVNKINNIKPNQKLKQMECEIWVSPINYKGYKLSRNKLVVFGLAVEEDKMLFESDEFVILQSGNKYFKLIKSSDFKPLKVFNDQSIIKLLD